MSLHGYKLAFKHYYAGNMAVCAIGGALLFGTAPFMVQPKPNDEILSIRNENPQLIEKYERAIHKEFQNNVNDCLGLAGFGAGAGVFVGGLTGLLELRNARKNLTTGELLRTLQ